ncbi:MAG: tetratricopeptide repeat protein [Holophagaceae bacterium]|nr:tetratricopeptide repeat protein [Holophagaceae bacterium]
MSAGGGSFDAALRFSAGSQSVAAEAECRALLEREPEHSDALHLLGMLLSGSGRLEEGLPLLARSLELRPLNPGFAINLAHALGLAGRLREAVEALEPVARAHPAFIPGRLKLGQLLRHEGRLQEAKAHFEFVAQVEPSNRDAWMALGESALATGRPGEAMPLLERAVALTPNDPVAQEYLLYARLFDPALEVRDLVAAHREWVRRFAPTRPGPAFAGKDPDARLKVAFLSPDFRRHSCAFFLEGLLRNLDRGQVRVFGYSDTLKPDGDTERLKQLCDEWRDVTGKSHAAVAEMIRADGIHAALDLAGHSASNRLPVFAVRPAPIQLSYLGYPATTGMDCFDGRIVDTLTDPAGSEAHGTEPLLRLGRTFLAYAPPPDAPAPGPSPADKNGFITFGSFNNLAKANDRVVALWASILRDCAGSRLLLKSHTLADGSVREGLCERFGRHGIDSERLDLRGWSFEGSPLLPYQEVDIALDPFPYAGTTTTCEALWMGVPVVTLEGSRHAGRVGVSLLNAVGHGELVAADEQSYQRIALELAVDEPRRNRMREGLRVAMAASSLCDGAGLARELEALLRRIWREKCREKG